MDTHPLPRQTILFADDDPVMRELVGSYLRREGYDVLEAPTGAAALALFEGAAANLIVLDVRLPDADGFDLLRRLRERGSTPVIMLTSSDTPMDRVLGLELGADDYVGKPFELRELKARIRSVLRRAEGSGETLVAEVSETLVFAGWTLDLTHRCLLDAEGTKVGLTSGEFDMLRVLAEHPMRPLSRDQLLDLTQSRGWTPFDRSVDVLIGRLRRKLAGPHDSIEIIKTVRSVGYVLAAAVKRRRAAPASLETAGD